MVDKAELEIEALAVAHRILRAQVARDLERYTALPKYKSPERDAALQALIASVETLSRLDYDWP